MFQRFLFQVVTEIGLFLLQLSGLWPFHYDRQSGKFTYLWYFSIIPVLIIGYPFFVMFYWSEFLSLDINVHFKNSALKVISYSYIVLNSISFVVLFVNQYLRFKRIKNLVQESDKLMNDLNFELNGIEFNYGQLLLKYSLKTMVLMSIMIYGITYSMSQLVTIEHHIFLVYVLSVIPNVIMRIYPDAFYGVLMLIKFYLSQINIKIARILRSAKDFNESQDVNEQKRYQKMRDFCELSDQLDRLTILQCKIVELSSSINQICSFQVTCWLFFGFCTFLINMFMEYVIISSSLKLKQFSVTLLLNGSIAVALVLAEVYLTATMSDSVVYEVHNDISKKHNFVFNDKIK